MSQRLRSPWKQHYHWGLSAGGVTHSDCYRWVMLGCRADIPSLLFHSTGHRASWVTPLTSKMAPTHLVCGFTCLRKRSPRHTRKWAFSVFLASFTPVKLTAKMNQTQRVDRIFLGWMERSRAQDDQWFWKDFRADVRAAIDFCSTRVCGVRQLWCILFEDDSHSATFRFASHLVHRTI